jgi:uncharacterized protein
VKEGPVNVPAIAKKSFDEFSSRPDFAQIISIVLAGLKQLVSPQKRARVVYELIDELNEEAFSHPLVRKLSPCKLGCSGCCHTQVSVTLDEAYLLLERIQQGIEIDRARLLRQASAQDCAKDYYELSYQERKCVFLGDKGECRVYEDRPSVCRTNKVLGESSQCDTTTSVQSTVMVKTPKADMVIYAAYLYSKESGALPHMLTKLIK